MGVVAYRRDRVHRGASEGVGGVKHLRKAHGFDAEIVWQMLNPSFALPRYLNTRRLLFVPFRRLLVGISNLQQDILAQHIANHLQANGHAIGIKSAG